MENDNISKKEALDTIKTIRDDISEQKNHEKGDFYSHLVVFAFVITLLWYVNLSHSPENIWAIYPTLGWGMSLVFHFLAYKKIIQDEKTTPTPKDDFRSHFFTYIVVILFLWGINFWTAHGNWWALYPTIFWGMWVVIHFIKSRK